MNATVPAPLLKLEGVGFRYEANPLQRRTATDVLSDIDLEITEGETLGVVGESGSGKSTLARLSLGLYRPTSGRVLFDGTPVRRGSRRSFRGQRQVVLQTPQWSLNPRLRCGTSVGEPLAIEGKGDRRSRREYVATLLEQVGLPPDIVSRYPHELSGGQQQRVAIARALVTRPRFVVLDEVVSALDVSVQAQILNLLKSLQEQRRFAVMFISHDLAVVRYVAHRVAVLYAGRVVELAPATVLYSTAAHPYTRALQLAHAPTNDTRFRLHDNLQAHPAGCPLANRCPLAMERCEVETPLLRRVGSSDVACHRAEDVTAMAPA